MKLRNKFVLIAIVLILLIFTLSCSVFASYTINGDYEGQHYEISLPDSLSEFNYKLIFVLKKGDYYWPDIFLSNDSFSFIGDKDYPSYVRLSLSREGQEVNGIGNIFNWLGNFFQSLWDFVYHIFIPTDEQWSEIKNDYYEMGDVVKSHIPFVGLFSEELKKAQATVEKTDPLVIRIPSFSYSGSGGIGVDTGVKEINLTQFYEPYRAYIRGFIFFVVVALAFVYIVKYVLNYGVTSAGQNIDTGDKGGNE